MTSTKPNNSKWPTEIHLKNKNQASRPNSFIDKDKRIDLFSAIPDSQKSQKSQREYTPLVDGEILDQSDYNYSEKYEKNLKFVEAKVGQEKSQVESEGAGSELEGLGEN